jgi:2-oxoglutarate ferredoxin oxidoreductase subunit gamma
MIYRFVFSGTGGQGVITAAIVLAEAALYYQGLNAVQTQVYGPEARGGSARSDVILADSEIWFPKVLEPNVAVCLSQQAYDKFSGVVRPGGIIVVDPHFVRIQRNVSSRQFEVALYDTVMGRNGRAQSINMCMLGAVAGLIPIVDPDSLRQAITERFSNSHVEDNLAAFDAGLNLISESVSTF